VRHMRPGYMTPFELACHAADRFRSTFGLDPDHYLRQLGFDPDTVRTKAVNIVVSGKRNFLLNRDWAEREQRFLRVQYERKIQEARAKEKLADRRLKRLRKVVKQVLAEAEAGKVRPLSIKQRIEEAERLRREDNELTIATEAELLQRYSEDVDANEPCDFNRGGRNVEMATI